MWKPPKNQYPTREGKMKITWLELKMAENIDKPQLAMSKKNNQESRENFYNRVEPDNKFICTKL